MVNIHILTNVDANNIKIGFNDMFEINLWWQGFFSAVGLWFFWCVAVAVGRVVERNNL